MISPSDASSASDPSSSPQGPQTLRAGIVVSARRISANRQNARKSTGPRTRAGKYRSALNLRSRSFVSEALERELRSRGEDPREFCRLQRDLAAIFHPHGPTDSAAVTMLATAWWLKGRRIRQWVGSGAAPCSELDARIEALLILVVSELRATHQPWKRRLVDAVGDPAGSPSEVRREIEGQLRLFGGKPATRQRPEAAPKQEGETAEESLRAYLERELTQILAESAARAGKPKANQTH